jgi:Arc/MetJ family transcription regulator
VDAGSVKTTIDIPEKALKEAIRHTGAKTKRDAIVTAVEEFNRRRRLEQFAERLRGSCPDFMTQEDLKRMREDHKREAGK